MTMRGSTARSTERAKADDQPTSRTSGLCQAPRRAQVAQAGGVGLIEAEAKGPYCPLGLGFGIKVIAVPGILDTVIFADDALADAWLKAHIEGTLTA